MAGPRVLPASFPAPPSLGLGPPQPRAPRVMPPRQPPRRCVPPCLGSRRALRREALVPCPLRHLRLPGLCTDAAQARITRTFRTGRHVHLLWLARRSLPAALHWNDPCASRLPRGCSRFSARTPAHIRIPAIYSGCRCRAGTGQTLCAEPRGALGRARGRGRACELGLARVGAEHGSPPPPPPTGRSWRSGARGGALLASAFSTWVTHIGPAFKEPCVLDRTRWWAISAAGFPRGLS